MEIAEIKDLLNKMNAFAEDGDSLDSAALMQDPIVLNRLAVELLQQIDRDVIFRIFGCACCMDAFR